MAEAARVLRPGGRLLLTSLARHEHRGVVEAYGHVNLGFAEKDLQKFATGPAWTSPAARPSPASAGRRISK